MSEVRTLQEGTLAHCKMSGTGNSWVTASGAGAQTGTLGFVRSFTYTSAETINLISDRGVPSHFKKGPTPAINISMTVAMATSAQVFSALGGGAGATVGTYGLEHRATAPEDGLSIFHHFYGFAVNSIAMTEGENENTYDIQGQALGYVGPTASGYILAGGA